MPISSSDLKMYRSLAVSEAGSNGGLMSNSEIPSGVTANLFPNASAYDRQAGATQYRKMFFKNANADNLPLLSARVWQDTNTEGQDKVTWFPTTQRSTQSNVTGSERQYGMGYLFAGVLAGGVSFQLSVEDGSVPLFYNGDLVRISNRLDPFSAGDEHWARIDQAPVVAGNLVTIHIATPTPVAFLSGAKVSSVYEAGDISPSFSAVADSSSLGTFSATNATLSNQGTVEQSWTLTFTSAVAFDIAGDTLGVVGSGNTSGGASPNNPQYNKPYFTIPASCFSGTFAIGDTVTFQTHPSSLPVFLRRVIPAGTVAVSNNAMSIYVDGESN